MRIARLLPIVTAAIIAAGPLFLAGCDDSKKNETVIPPVPPAEQGKDSMDYYRNQQKTAKKPG